MKYFILFLAAILTSCSSKKISKTFSSQDFSVEQQPYYEEWSGGAPGSGSGVTLYFPTSVMEGHTLQAIYFQGMENNIANFISNDKKMLVTRFRYSSSITNMSSDSKEEFGNEAPQLDTIPFQLLDDQAVIAFQADGKLKFVQLNNIIKKESIAFPSAPAQNGIN